MGSQPTRRQVACSVALQMSRNHIDYIQNVDVGVGIETLIRIKYMEDTQHMSKNLNSPCSMMK